MMASGIIGFVGAWSGGRPLVAALTCLAVAVGWFGSPARAQTEAPDGEGPVASVWHICGKPHLDIAGRVSALRKAGWLLVTTKNRAQFDRVITDGFIAAFVDGGADRKGWDNYEAQISSMVRSFPDLPANSRQPFRKMIYSGNSVAALVLQEDRKDGQIIRRCMFGGPNDPLTDFFINSNARDKTLIVVDKAFERALVETSTFTPPKPGDPPAGATSIQLTRLKPYAKNRLGRAPRVRVGMDIFTSVPASKR